MFIIVRTCVTFVDRLSSDKLILLLRTTLLVRLAIPAHSVHRVKLSIYTTRKKLNRRKHKNAEVNMGYDQTERNSTKTEYVCSMQLAGLVASESPKAEREPNFGSEILKGKSFRNGRMSKKQDA